MTVLVPAYETRGATCPACKSRDCVVYHNDEDEHLVCDHCFYEEWGQPLGTYPQLRPTA